MRRLVLLAAAAATLACAACGNADGLRTVRGKVLFRGEPAVGATVYFHRKNAAERPGAHTPQGVVGEDGGFTLTSPAGKGALPGDYAVLVEWKEGVGNRRGRSPALTAPDRLRGRYMNLTQPLLHAEVKASSNTLPPFELN
jgi:hypothetical protein